METYIEEVLGVLSGDHRRAVLEMDPHYGRGPGHLVDAFNWPIGYARSILRDLVREGVCVLTALFSEDDGLTCGRGYWLETFGRAVRERIEQEEADVRLR